jgi:hypothetical protein
MIEIMSVNPKLAPKVCGLNIDMPVVCKVGLVDGQVAASGGLAWGQGRCWIWFVVEGDLPKGHGLAAIHQCRKMVAKAKQLGESAVYAIRDSNYETSERLLTLAGFRKTDEQAEEQEVWACQV